MRNWIRAEGEEFEGMGWGGFLVGPQKPLLVTVRLKLAWFGHVICRNSLSKTIFQGTLEGGQHYGWHRKCWLDNIKEWTSLPMLE